MRRQLSSGTRAWFGLAVVSAALAAGCGEKSPGDVGPSKVVDGQVFVMTTEIQGPASIAPGQSAQYTAIEYLSDGKTRVPPTAVWTSSDPSLVQVSSSGVATAQSRGGEFLLSVRTTKSGSKPVLVLPANTFRLVGSVADSQGAALANARVQVIDGPTATTDSRGIYRLYGVPAEADLYVTRDGFIPVEQHLQLTSHTSFDFRMPASIEGWIGSNLSGQYTLTLEASCGGMAKPLVAELRRRSYEATVTQNGSSLQVVLTEPRFEDWHSEDAGRFTGNITSTGVNFYIGRDRAGWFSLLWERLPDGSTLQIEGSANTTESSGVLSGALAGWFTYLGSKGEPLGECDGSRFTLSRR